MNKIFSRLLEWTQEGVYQYTFEDGKLLYANRGLAKILDLDLEPDEIIGKKISDLVEYTQKPGTIRETLAKQGQLHGFEYHFKTLKGDDRWVIHDSIMREDPESGQRVVEVIVRDITDKKLMREKLKFERKQLLSIFDSINQAIYVTDTETYEVLYANKFLTKLLGKSPLGKKCYKEFQNLNAPCSFCTNDIILKRKGEPYQWEFYNRNLKRYYMIIDRLIKWPDGRDVRFELAIDITSGKKAEAELKKMNLELEERVRERTRELKEAQEKLIKREKLAVLGQLAGTVSHELRNPLGAIRNSIYYLTKKNPDLDEKSKKHFRIMREAILRATNLTEELLDYTRSPKTNPTQLNLGDLLRNVLNKIKIPDNIRLEIPMTDESLIIYADREQIQSIIRNIILNAIQAMRNGGELIINNGKRDNMVFIEITDTGDGMTQEIQKQSFEPLFTTRAKGTGLGLPLCKRYVELNNGNIEVRSIPGKGSTFTILLPLME